MSEVFTPKAFIASLTFSDGSIIEIEKDDVIVVVGPNNAGKSAALRAIRDKLQHNTNESPVLSALRLTKEGTSAQFDDWLLDWPTRQKNSRPENPTFQALGHSVNKSQANANWIQGNNTLGSLTRWFCHLLSADERLQICNPANNIAITVDNPTHPIHFMLRDDTVEHKISEKFKNAFGVDLILHRNAGTQIPIHVGLKPSMEDGEDRVSFSYIEKLEKLPTLHTQGDGMRSFAGVLMATSVGRESILMIDEPEAFLHPPQARLLGSTLIADLEGKDQQKFIATHSTNILRGILDSDSSKVKVLRIRRSKDVNKVKLLSNDKIKELWDDPLLRYSNILDGLFHESVVVCESDGDCRFYSAILDALINLKGSSFRRPDVMFTHCGGKARLSVVVKALREVEVPIKVVADFDILSSVEPLKSLVESLGGDWQLIEPHWKLVSNSITQKKPELETSEVKQEIQEIFDSVTEKVLPKRIKPQIEKILKRSSPWAHAKTVGCQFIPSGDPTKAYIELDKNLKELGLFVVPVGELEGFVRSEGNHGPRWVNSVLTKDLEADQELETARNFVAGFCDIDN